MGSHCCSTSELAAEVVMVQSQCPYKRNKPAVWQDGTWVWRVDEVLCERLIRRFEKQQLTQRRKPNENVWKWGRRRKVRELLLASEQRARSTPPLLLWDSVCSCPPVTFHQLGGKHWWGHCKTASVGTSALYLSFTLVHIRWMSRFWECIIHVYETPNYNNKPQRKSDVHTLEIQACYAPYGWWSVPKYICHGYYQLVT